MQMIDENTSRADLEIAIIENGILPTASAADCATVRAMSNEQLLAAVRAWIAEGDECADVGDENHPTCNECGAEVPLCDCADADLCDGCGEEPLNCECNRTTTDSDEE